MTPASRATPPPSSGCRARRRTSCSSPSPTPTPSATSTASPPRSPTSSATPCPASLSCSRSRAPRHGRVAEHDSDGQAQFCYIGTFPGGDAIGAFADTDDSGGQDAGEPADEATKSWVLPASTEGCKVTNGGQITAASGDEANFGGNAQVNNGAKGNETYQDHGPATALKVKSIKVLVVTCNSSRTRASIFGTAEVDGQGSFDFRIDVADNGEPGSNDTYRIRVSNGYDSGEQPLEGGTSRSTEGCGLRA